MQEDNTMGMRVNGRAAITGRPEKRISVIG